jgi:hypothetical protein
MSIFTKIQKCKTVKELESLRNEIDADIESSRQNGVYIIGDIHHIWNWLNSKKRQLKLKEK